MLEPEMNTCYQPKGTANTAISTPESKPLDCSAISKPLHRYNFLFNVDYQENTLSMNWNFSRVPVEQGYSCRHVLVIDLSNEQFAKEVLSLYYRMMPLGDFLKILDSNLAHSLAWIERTGAEFNTGIIPVGIEPKRVEGKLNSTVIKLAQKYPEPTYVCFLIDGWDSISANTIIGLRSMANACFPELYIALFSSIDSLTSRTADRVTASCNFSSLGWNLIDYKAELKRLFASYCKIRVRCLTITLSCLESQLEIREKTKQSMHSNGPTLNKTFYYLNNYDNYVCRLKLDSPERRQLNFSVEFSLELLNGTKFQTSKSFSVEPERTLWKTAPTEQTPNKGISMPSTDQPMMSDRLIQNSEIDIEVCFEQSAQQYCS